MNLPAGAINDSRAPYNQEVNTTSDTIKCQIVDLDDKMSDLEFSISINDHSDCWGSHIKVTADVPEWVKSEHFFTEQVEEIIKENVAGDVETTIL